jgi:hypothetical protein
MALDAAHETPSGSIFLIPVRLEDCRVPDELSRYQYVDWFSPDGPERLLQAIATELRQRRR